MMVAVGRFGAWLLEGCGMRVGGFRAAGRTALSTGRAVAAGLLGVALTSCSGEEPAPQNFAPLHYEYLTPIRLNVATIDVENQASSPDGDLALQSPFTPEAALERMARDRLVAAGPSGTATFTVTEASIVRGDDGLTERLSAHLDIASADGARAGYAEAHVTRSLRNAGAGPAAGGRGARPRGRLPARPPSWWAAWR